MISTSCVKKEKEYPTYYFGKEYRDYVLYKPGSYWIYQEASSGEIDSIYLYKQDIYINKPTSKINYNYEGISENKTSSLHDTLTFSGSVLSEHERGEFKEIIITDNVHSNVYYFEGEIGYSAFSASYTFYVEKRDSLQFTDNRFFEVKIFERMKEIYLNQPQKTYYAKNVGFCVKNFLMARCGISFGIKFRSKNFDCINKSGKT